MEPAMPKAFMNPPKTNNTKPVTNMNADSLNFT